MFSRIVTNYKLFWTEVYTSRKRLIRIIKTWSFFLKKGSLMYDGLFNNFSFDIRQPLF
jgi:hypothetical protein